MLIYKLIFLFTFATILNATPLRVSQQQITYTPTLVSDGVKLYEVSNKRLTGKPIPLPFLDQVFELKSEDGEYTEAHKDDATDRSSTKNKKYFILKEVSKDELPEETEEIVEEPSGVFIVPREETFDYYKAGALSKIKSEQSTHAKVIPFKNAQNQLKESSSYKPANYPRPNNLKIVGNFTKQSDDEITKKIFQDIIDSYRAAAIDEKTNRPLLSENREDELLPPPFGQNEKNYYLEKASKKTKKYEPIASAATETVFAEVAQPDVFHHQQETEEEEEDVEGETEEDVAEDDDDEVDDGEEDDSDNETTEIKAQITMLPTSEIGNNKKIDSTNDFKSALKPADYVSFEGYHFYQPQFTPLPTKPASKKIPYVSLIKDQPQIYKDHKESTILLNKGEVYPAAVKQKAVRKTGENDYDGDYDDEELNNEETNTRYTNINQGEPVGISGDTGSRITFQMHGTNGPHSYKFGYDTGKGKDRQFRLEERDNDGNVRGHYGYKDKRGIMKIVKYIATRDGGFQIEN